MADTIHNLGEQGVHPNTFALDPSAELEHLGAGFNSQVVRSGEFVLKISKKPKEPSAARKLARTMLAEQNALAEFVGDNLPPTMYVLASDEKDPTQARIVTVQQFMAGVSIAKYTEEPLNNTVQLWEFLEAGLDMYDQTRQVPDLANIEGRFNMFRNGNVVIREDEKDAGKPYLVDTNFGKTQRSKLLGPLWSRAIAWGVRRGMSKLPKPKFPKEILYISMDNERFDEEYTAWEIRDVRRCLHELKYNQSGLGYARQRGMPPRLRGEGILSTLAIEGSLSPQELSMKGVMTRRPTQMFKRMCEVLEEKGLIKQVVKKDDSPEDSSVQFDICGDILELAVPLRSSYEVEPPKRRWHLLKRAFANADARLHPTKYVG